MKSVLKKTLYIIVIYLFLMIVVSAGSFLFSTESLGESHSNSHTMTVETKQEETVSSVESTEPVKTNPSDSQPFDFSVNVITEVDESNTHIILPRPIPKTEPPNPLGTLLAELDKRKHFIVRICMRRCKKKKGA